MLAHTANIELREEPISELNRYAAVPSVFETHTVFDVIENPNGLELREREIGRPYKKDYDSVESPLEWPTRFDVSNWTLIGAFRSGERVGGAIGALNSPDLGMLEGRGDVLVLWDIRVSPRARRLGIGSSLFRRIEAWGSERRCRELRVETQNTNVGACRFYARQGCRLTRARYHAYSRLPDEVQLIWSKAVGA